MRLGTGRRSSAEDAGQESLTANLTSTAAVPVVYGQLGSGRREAVLLFNARVGIEPDCLRRIFHDCLDRFASDGVEARVTEINSFAPARPQPTHRFDYVVR